MSLRKEATARTTPANNPRQPHASFVVTSDQADRRLDRVLRGLYPSVPLGAIMKALRKGGVRIDGLRAKGDARLAAGSVVTTPWGGEERERPVIPASAEPLDTIYRDEYVWCVNKPAGLLSQPDGSGSGSVVTDVWSALSWTREDFRPAAVHRLDRNVSGVILVALTAPVLRTLSECVRLGEVKKIYRAVVMGETPPFGAIDAPLLKDEAENIVRVDASGRDALTRYRTLATTGAYSLVELELVTGRPHQARAHLASIAHPIAGDRKYGATDACRRIFLHAHSLTLPKHPALPESLRGAVFTAEPPKEFDKIPAP
jgi:23S rRNA pseudouridine955/2504/2580 synthase